MLAQAVSTTAILLGVSLLSKLLLETHVPVGGHAHELLRQAVHWRDVALQDADPATRLQHLATAAALLQAARTIARDADLERASGVDVPRLARSLETQVVDVRQILQPVRTKTTTETNL